MTLRNPIDMRGRLETCWLFSYRTKPEQVRRFLPPKFEPLLYEGFAFWNLLVCRVAKMRPHFLPAAFGLSYWHVAYRIPVRYPTLGKELEGLYFVRSDCDSPLIAGAGNMITDFNFNQASITVKEQETTRIVIGSSEAPSTIELGRGSPLAAEAGSPFPDLETADRFLKYKPAALSVLPDGGVQILRIGRDEAAWKNRLRRVESADWKFLRDKDATLELCQEVEPIDYLWKKGQRVDV